MLRRHQGLILGGSGATTSSVTTRLLTNTIKAHLLVSTELRTLPSRVPSLSGCATPRFLSAKSSTEAESSRSTTDPSKRSPTRSAASHATLSPATPSPATPSRATPSRATPSRATASRATPSAATPSAGVIGSNLGRDRVEKNQNEPDGGATDGGATDEGGTTDDGGTWSQMNIKHAGGIPEWIEHWSPARFHKVGVGLTLSSLALFPLSYHHGHLEALLPGIEPPITYPPSYSPPSYPRPPTLPSYSPP